MKLAELHEDELRHRLRGAGLLLHTAQWRIRIQSPLPSIAQGLALLYADFEVSEADTYADFQIRVAPPANLRRWIKPQVVFYADGHPPFKPLPLNQAFPMLEWGLNWCISDHCHDHLMIHAAVVEKGGQAMILPGQPGAGKSTLTAALICRGWRLLSDELTLIRLSDRRITPLPRPVSLKNRSIEIIRAFAPEGVLSPPVHDTLKGTVAHLRPPGPSVARALECASGALVVFPLWQDQAPLSLTPVCRATAFVRLADNGFNYGPLGETAFDALADLMDGCTCHDLRYSRLEDALPALEALLPA